jgi:hypothetical protein
MFPESMIGREQHGKQSCPMCLYIKPFRKLLRQSQKVPWSLFSWGTKFTDLHLGCRVDKDGCRGSDSYARGRG